MLNHARVKPFYVTLCNVILCKPPVYFTTPNKCVICCVAEDLFLTQVRSLDKICNYSNWTIKANVWGREWLIYIHTYMFTYNIYSDKTIFPFPFKFVGMWSWWQFFFQIERNTIVVKVFPFVCFLIIRKTVVTIVFLSIRKEL